MRDHFLLDPELTFLNHGSFGACPREVFEVYQRWQLELERNPVAFLGRHSAAHLAQARQTLGKFLGASGEDLVFIANATTGVNLVARSLDLKPGDEVLTTDHEYGACDAALQFVCERVGAAVRRVQVPLPYDPVTFAARVLAEVRPSTRLVYASHVTSTTALIFDVAALCAGARALGIPTLIDGAHAPGHVDLQLDLLGADYYTGNCHKWLCAPKGAAFLHVRPEHQERVHASVVSWGYLAHGGGHTGFDAYTGRSTLERRLQWQGTRDLSAFLSVPAAIRFHARPDVAQRRQSCHALALQALHATTSRNGLAPIAPDAAFGQMVPIPVQTSDPESLRQWLFDAHRIEVPVTQHAGQCFVRLSVQVYNAWTELERLLQALALAPA